MGSRSGYEYGYSFRMDDDIISLYNREPLFLGMGTRQLKGFVFEIRTNFILKRRLDDGGADEIIDSEKLAATLPEDCDENWLKMNLTYRLKEYWMFDDEIDNLFREAIAFAKRTAADPKYASLLVIPVVVSLDVCTVQLEGEPADSARGRAIRTEGLIPMNMCPWPMAPIPFGPTLPVSMREIDFYLQVFLLSLPTVRVEDAVEGLALMEVCPICLRSPTVSSQISSLRCNHAFHKHCVTQWLLKSKSCPTIHSSVVKGARLVRLGSAPWVTQGVPTRVRRRKGTQGIYRTLSPRLRLTASTTLIHRYSCLGEKIIKHGNSKGK
ncbi:hypothetical protein DH2020_017432 [Rehmannia glutinosa]|uniref:RING-type domain-containing protein n=1 Tax=Rehmannia glutinosa TaxID=99300 RepID=A0ABR0WU77_REHGL